MCDENQQYYAYAELNMPNGSKQVIQLKYTDDTAVYNTPTRLRMTLSGSNPNMKKVSQVNYNGVLYVPNSDILYNINNCTAGGIFFGDKMIFPYVPYPMQLQSIGVYNRYGGKNKTRKSRKGAKKSRRTRRRRTIKKH